MAERLIFISADEGAFYSEEMVNFTYYSGFAISQKQKSIRSLHENAISAHPGIRPLEISTKSEEPLGVRLSAFNLCYYDDQTQREYPLENIFQASKVYEFGGPFADILTLSPKDAKKDTRHHTSGALKSFRLGDWECPLEPKTMFYDWIYCTALSQNKDTAAELLNSGYNAFTDIEFNHNESHNCQARAAAIFVSLSRRDQLNRYLKDKKLWKCIYSN